jgi:uncharacterized membrane protein YbhN (UPF0104 family)
MRNMLDRLRPWFPLLKAILTLAIVVGVVVLFVRILQSEELQAADRTRSPGQILWDQLCAARPGALVVGGLLYIGGLAFSLAFWVVTLYRVREPLPWWLAARAYYLSHLGKYAPIGKGWALLMRATQSATAGIRAGTAALTGAYEVFTTMAAGALLAAIVLILQAGEDRSLMWRALALLTLAGVPILPGVFQPVVRRVAARFQADASCYQRLGLGTLLAGLALTAVGWGLLGASLAATLQALAPEPGSFTLRHWASCTAFVSISNVAGFIASTPGGLGVREIVLQQLLAPQLGAQAVVVVVMLRLLWTVAELTIAGVLWWLPARSDSVKPIVRVLVETTTAGPPPEPVCQKP